MMSADVPILDFAAPPKAVYKVQEEYSERGPVGGYCPNGNFLKGVKWSPDGACFLTASDDNWLRVYDLPTDALDATPVADSGECAALAAAPDSFAPPLRIKEGELVYDYAWYSRMVASEPASCCFATTCRAHPIHLWDAVTAELRCSYLGYDDKDEVDAAFSLAFSPDGAQLAAGGNKLLRLFDTATPGRKYTAIKTHAKTHPGQPGIISCLAYSPVASGVLASGSYSGIAALYDTHMRSATCTLAGHTGGITQVQFSPDGHFLYSGARRDAGIICWDVRNTLEPLYRIQRASAATNQRIQFSIEPCGRHLATGGEDGVVRIFDLRDGGEVGNFRAADDTVNGIEFHPYLPFAASASGHRRFPVAEQMSDDEENTDPRGSPSASAAPPGAAEGKLPHTAQQLADCLLVWRFELGQAETEPPNVEGSESPRGEQQE